MALDKAMEALKFDSRMEEWNLRHGRVTKQELENYKQGLDDCSANAESLSVEEKQESGFSDAGPSSSDMLN